MSSPIFRFVHASDLHLDAPFSGLRSAPPAVAHELSGAPLTAWDALVQLTLDENAAFLVIAGGICDGAPRAVPAQLRFLAGLQRLSARGIRTFVVCGEDDPVERWAAIHQWPEGVHCLASHDVESVSMTTSGGHAVTIHGISHSHDRAGNRAARFRRGSEPGIHIGVMHAKVNTGGATSWDRVALSDLQAAGMDYWALGHDHRHQQLSDRSPWIVYPGTLQGRSLENGETGPKGAVVVTVADGAIRDAAHHSLDAVRLTRTQIDVSACGGPSDVRRALAAASARVRSENPGRTVVATCDLRGRAQTWMAADPADDLWDRLLEELRRERVDNGGLVWWDSLSDLTEVGEISSDHDASLHVHRLAEVWKHAPASLDRLLADNRMPFPGPVAGSQTAVDSLEIADLLARAERVALSLLEREEQ